MRAFKELMKGLAVFLAVAVVVFLIVSIVLSACHNQSIITEWQQWFGITNSAELEQVALIFRK